VNIALHIAYGLKESSLLVTALVLAVGQAVCFVAAGILLVAQKRRPKTLFTIPTRDDPLQGPFNRLQIEDRCPDKDTMPSNIDQIRQIWV
jgi:hypothetical protein